jgi:hypothetical protein
MLELNIMDVEMNKQLLTQPKLLGKLFLIKNLSNITIYKQIILSYLTGKPGLCLSVSGPGMTNCISGLANAKENCWPMILVGGSCDLRQ